MDDENTQKVTMSRDYKFVSKLYLFLITPLSTLDMYYTSITNQGERCYQVHLYWYYPLLLVGYLLNRIVIFYSHHQG